MTVEYTVSHSKTPRNYQELPPLYFVAMDDWLEKLGEKSFCLYLKLYTMVDRTAESSEDHCIKTRTSKLIKKLDMSKSKYIRLIQPLYEYGLVDLIEYEESKNMGSKPVNIVVHKHPQNRFDLSVQPLEKCRSWEQRTDDNYNFTKQGGRPKKEVAEEVQEEVQEVPDEQSQPEEDVLPIELNAELDPVIITEYEHFHQDMVVNGADMKIVNQWVNKNHQHVPAFQICYVFKQIATWSEPVRKTSVFINKALENASSFYTPVTYKRPADPVDQTERKRVPFYNWLEQ